MEIALVRPKGRPNDVVLHASDSHPNMLVVIGLAGLKHGDVFGFDEIGREKMRAWFFGQDRQPPSSLAAQSAHFVRSLDNSTRAEYAEALNVLTRIAADSSESDRIRVIAHELHRALDE
jgi:hypothetical protein